MDKNLLDKINLLNDLIHSNPEDKEKYEAELNSLKQQLDKSAAVYDSHETDHLMTEELASRDDYGTGGDGQFHDYPEDSNLVRPWALPKNQQELWNMFREHLHKKRTQERNKKKEVGKEDIAARPLGPGETDGYWDYRKLPYDIHQSPTTFMAMPAMKLGSLEDEYGNHHVSITFEFMQNEIKISCTWDIDDLPPDLTEAQTLPRIVKFLVAKLPPAIAQVQKAQIKDLDLPNRTLSIIIPLETPDA